MCGEGGKEIDRQRRRLALQLAIVQKRDVTLPNQLTPVGSIGQWSRIYPAVAHWTAFSLSCFIDQVALGGGCAMSECIGWVFRLNSEHECYKLGNVLVSSPFVVAIILWFCLCRSFAALATVHFGANQNFLPSPFWADLPHWSVHLNWLFDCTCPK